MVNLISVPLAPLIRAHILRYVSIPEKVELELAGVAGSGRKYYRIRVLGIPYVLQQSFAGDADFDRFVAYCELFSDLGLPTPRIHALDRSGYQVLLDDLGTLQLWDHCLAADPQGAPRPSANSCGELYRRVLTELSRWQSASASAFAANADLRSREFDFKALRWETEYFTEHYLQGHKGLGAESIAALLPLFDTLAQRVAGHPRGLMHRDFQSQNVMVDPSGRIGFVDFQGARHGSLYYDAASLLWDPYVHSDASVVRAWFEEWSRNNANLPAVEASEHWSCFLEASLQRLMQAMGAYCNLSRNKGLTAFIKHIVPGEERLRCVLKEYEERPHALNLQPLRAFLETR